MLITISLEMSIKKLAALTAHTLSGMARQLASLRLGFCECCHVLLEELTADSRPPTAAFP